jgi:hypothetical protein
MENPECVPLSSRIALKTRKEKKAKRMLCPAKQVHVFVPERRLLNLEERKKVWRVVQKKKKQKKQGRFAFGRMLPERNA